MRITTPLIILAAALSTLACGPKNKDKLEVSELAKTMNGGEAQAPEPDARCTAQVVQDEVRRQLFARAAEIRGANGDNYTRIAGFSVLQLNGAAPVAPVSAAELVDCRGNATLRLPAGLKVAGGRTALGGDIGYSIAPGPRGVVTLGQSDSLAIPLATLTQNRASAPATPASPALEPIPVPEPGPVAAPRDNRPINPAPPPRAESTASSNPSFDCRRARRSSERAVCGSDSLAALDRNMSAQYRAAVADADPEQRRLLAQTRNRFLGFRNRCGEDEGCIAGTYRGRMREIDDIAAGRWRGQR